MLNQAIYMSIAVVVLVAKLCLTELALPALVYCVLYCVMYIKCIIKVLLQFCPLRTFALLIWKYIFSIYVHTFI